MSEEKDTIELQARAESFVSRWNASVSDDPELRLDWSFASVGVVDRLLLPLRGAQLDRESELFLHGVACYLGLLVERCWRKAQPEATVELASIEAPRWDVALTIESADFLAPRQKLRIEFVAWLKKILSGKLNPLPVYSVFSLPIPPGGMQLGPALAGILCFRSAHLVGSLEHDSDEALLKSEARACEFLAESHRDHFSRRYPLLRAVQDEHFFYRFFTLPPDFQDDRPPLLHRLYGVISQFRAEPVEESERQALLWALTASSDDLCAKIGFSLLSGLQRGIDLSQPIFMAATALGPQAARMREAAFYVREIEGFVSNWLELLYAGDVAGAQRMLDLDYHLGFAPICIFPMVGVLEEFAEAPFTLMFSSTDVVNSKLIAEIEAGFPQRNPAVKLWLASLQIRSGALDEAGDILKRLEQELSVDMREHYASLQQLLAQHAARAGAAEQAIELWQRYLSLESQDMRKRDEVTGLLATALFAQGKTEAALQLLDESLGAMPYGFYTRVADVEVALSLADFVRAQASLEFLRRAAPFNPMVFSLVRRLIAMLQ